VSESDPRAGGGPGAPAPPDVTAVGGEGVRSGVAYLYVARIFVAAAGWAGTVVIVRTLSPSDWGRYSFVFGLLGIIGFVVDLQIGRIVLREVIEARADAGRVVGSYISLRLLIGLVSFVVAVAVVLAGRYDTTIVWATVVGAIGFFFIAPANGFVVWFQARVWLRPFAVGTVAGAVVQLAIVLAVAASDNGTVVLFALAATAGQVTVLAWRLWALHRRHMVFRLRAETGQWWTWIKEAIPLSIGAALFSVYYRIDIVMLEALDSARAVGEYTIGYKFADLAIFFPEALLTPVMTLFVAAWPHDASSLRRHVRQSFVLLAVAAVAIGVGFALVAGPLIELLYGDRYATATGASRLLVTGSVIQYVSYLCFMILVAIGRNRPYALAGLAGLVVNVALNLILIPAYSFDGSAIATVVTELVVAVLLIMIVRHTPGILSVPWPAIARAALAGVVMAGVYLGAVVVLPWVVAAGLAGVVFIAALHVLRVDGPGGLRTLARNARFELTGDEADDPDAQAATPSDR
jgi:O-antigen/teichoic acid export membrane protein